MIFAIVNLLIKLFDFDENKALRVARWILVGVAVCVLIAGVIMFRSCKSATERRIEERQPVIVETQQGANQAINAAVNANKEANDAQTAVNRVQKDKQTNVSIEEANKNRCIAFPESCK